MRIFGKMIVLTLMTAALAACSADHGEGGHGEHESHDFHSLMERIEALSRDSLSYRIDPVRERALISRVRAEVAGATRPFFVTTRQDKLRFFPCQSCHTVPLSELRATTAPDSVKRAHWDVHVVHADAATMECTSCHNENNLGQLRSLTGKPIFYDHSYKLCGQCHSTQFKDWIGGAHGKQEGGWVPPRITRNCTGCHNPHRPAFESRWPARLNIHEIIREQGVE